MFPIRPRRKRAAGDSKIKHIFKIKQTGILNAAIAVIEHPASESIRHNQITQILLQSRSQCRMRPITFPVHSAIMADRVTKKNRIRQRSAGNPVPGLRPRRTEQHVNRISFDWIANHCRIQDHLTCPIGSGIRSELKSFPEVHFAIPFFRSCHS